MLILAVDNNASDRITLSDMIMNCCDKDDEFLMAESGEQAISIITDRAVDILITDIFLPNISCLDLLEAARRKKPPIETIVITASNSMETAARLLQEGAFDYLSKPLHKTFVEEKIKRIKEYVKAQRTAHLFKLKQEELKKNVVATIESFNGDYHLMKSIIAEISDTLKSKLPDRVKLKRISENISPIINKA